jgi:hypothetical protein
MIDVRLDEFRSAAAAMKFAEATSASKSNKLRRVA